MNADQYEPVDAVDAVDHAAAVRFRSMHADGVRLIAIYAWVRGIAAEVDALGGDEPALLVLAERIERGMR